METLSQLQQERDAWQSRVEALEDVLRLLLHEVEDPARCLKPAVLGQSPVVHLSFPAVFALQDAVNKSSRRRQDSQPLGQPMTVG